MLHADAARHGRLTPGRAAVFQLLFGGPPSRIFPRVRHGRPGATHEAPARPGCAAAGQPAGGGSALWVRRHQGSPSCLPLRGLGHCPFPGPSAYGSFPPEIPVAHEPPQDGHGGPHLGSRPQTGSGPDAAHSVTPVPSHSPALLHTALPSQCSTGEQSPCTLFQGGSPAHASR